MVLNRFDPKVGLTPQRIEAEAGITVDITIQEFGPQFTQHGNMGKPAIEKFRPFRQAILDLSHEVGLAGVSRADISQPARPRFALPGLRLLGRSTSPAT
jgi:hypothetical protein